MFPHIRNPFDSRSNIRPPGNPDTPKFLRALGDDVAAELYDEAMGKDASSSTTDAQEQELSVEELARLQAVKDRERGRELVELRKRDYLEWAQEFDLGGTDTQDWIDEAFTFNPDGTVEVDGDLKLSDNDLTRLPTGLTRVNGNLDLAYNQLTSLEGLPQEIHGDLYLGSNQLTSLEGLPSEIHGNLDLSGNQLTSLEGSPQEIHGYLNLVSNQLTSLEGLQGSKVDGDLYFLYIPATSIPEGIELGGEVVVNADQTALKADAKSKGYRVKVWA